MVTGVHRENIMKQFITCLVAALITFCASAQKDVTKFLGIPVDGSKSEMIQKLKDKGFRSNPIHQDVLEGEFNGTQVNVHIGTNGNKVWRIMVCDANTVGERDIQIRFNKLCQQFEKNSKYFSWGNDKIPEDEDISYEMTVHKKRYQARFYQMPIEPLDSAQSREYIVRNLRGKYSDEELANPTEGIKQEIIDLSVNYVMNMYAKKPVWFMISEIRGNYYIAMFYDNEYNHADGEDL